MKTFVEMTWNDPPVRLESKVSVWLVIFAGTNFRKTGQIQVSKTLAVLIFTVGESRTHRLVSTMAKS